MKSSIEEIQDKRQSIDHIHQEILELLLQRNELAEAIWIIKKQNAFTYVDENREIAILQQITQNKKISNNSNLQKMFSNIFKSILKENKNYLNQKMKDQNEI
jgi:chorismate mutase